MKHKEGCRMSDLNIELVCCNSTGSDPALEITEAGIRYSANVHTENNEGDWGIKFNYCPVCGIKLSEPNADLTGEAVRSDNLFDFAHELWAVAQVMPNEGIEDAVGRIVEFMKSNAGASVDSSTLLAECLEELERLQSVVGEEDYYIIQALLDKANDQAQISSEAR